MTLRSHTLWAVIEEMERQDRLWGLERDERDGTGSDGDRIVAEACKLNNEAMAKRGTLTWRDILEEEVFEAFAETDPEKLATELVQVAAVAVNWATRIRERVTS